MRVNGDVAAPALTSAAREAYDQLPYPVFAFRATHPDRLAAIGTYYGMQPPSADGCSVLELGCAAGGNLIPMAEQFPGGRFVGLDLSSVQIAEGNERVARLGLKNIELLSRDLMDAQLGDEKFDYIICHGVYSWVPQVVREAILRICAEHLSSEGIAYISYNTFPGWRTRGVLADILGHHTNRSADDEEVKSPAARAAKAREILEVLSNEWDGSRDTRLRYLHEEVEHILEDADSYIYHAYLGDVNQPFYVREFATDVGKQGLQYLSDAHPRQFLGMDLRPETRAALREICGDDVVEREQYLDFLRCENFRRSLIVRADVTPQREFDLAPFERMYFSSEAKASDAVNLADAVTVRFRDGKSTLETSEPLLKAAMVLLTTRFPGRAAFGELLESSLAMLKIESADRAIAGRGLAEGLLLAYSKRTLEFFARDADFAATLSEKPVARPLARAEARTFRYVVNLQHETVRLDAVEIALIELLDGTRDRAGLERELLTRGDLGSVVELSDQVDEALKRFLRRGLLVA